MPLHLGQLLFISADHDEEQSQDEHVLCPPHSDEHACKDARVRLRRLLDLVVSFIQLSQTPGSRQHTGADTIVEVLFPDNGELLTIDCDLV